MQKSDHLTLFPSVYLFEVWLVLDLQCFMQAKILLIVPFSYIYILSHMTRGQKNVNLQENSETVKQ